MRFTRPIYCRPPTPPSFCPSVRPSTRIPGEETFLHSSATCLDTTRWAVGNPRTILCVANEGSPLYWAIRLTHDYSTAEVQLCLCGAQGALTVWTAHISKISEVHNTPLNMLHLPVDEIDKVQALSHSLQPSEAEHPLLNLGKRAFLQVWPRLKEMMHRLHR